MKRIKTILTMVFIALILTFNNNVFAATGALSTSASKVYVGDSFTTTVYTISAAAWNIHVSASGPVSGCSINEVGDTGDESNKNKTFTATCKATGTGTITISLSGDVSQAMDNHDITNSPLSGTKTVTVTEKPAPAPTPTPTPTPTPAKEETKKEEVKSDNNKLKEISVEGFELLKIDDNNYSLTVTNDVEKINISATAEDAKAVVIGIGEKELTVGENNIEVVVTSEDGKQNKISLKIIRKEVEEEPEPVDVEEPTDVEPEVEEDSFNLIPIIMVALNVILVIAVVVLYKKNKKLKENNN